MDKQRRQVLEALLALCAGGVVSAALPIRLGREEKLELDFQNGRRTVWLRQETRLGSVAAAQYTPFDFARMLAQLQAHNAWQLEANALAMMQLVFTQLAWANMQQQRMLQAQWAWAMQHGVQLGAPTGWPHVRSIYGRGVNRGGPLLVGVGAAGNAVGIQTNYVAADTVFKLVHDRSGQAAAERAVGPQSIEQPSTIELEGHYLDARGYRTKQGGFSTSTQKLRGATGRLGHITQYTDHRGRRQIVWT